MSGSVRGSGGLPHSIRASILARFSMLGRKDRCVLEHAAALGYRFDRSLLALATQCNVPAILRALRRARDLNIVVKAAPDERRFRFRHTLTRQTIYEHLSAVARRTAHRRILRALESLEDRDGRLEELAYHAWEARDVARALDYNERAGEAAQRLRAAAEARACFERALAIATDEGDRARLLARIGTTA